MSLTEREIQKQVIVTFVLKVSWSYAEYFEHSDDPVIN